MPSPALQQLIDLQRSMYDRALSEARESSGGDSQSIANYQQEFETSLPNDFSSVPARKILEAIDRHRIVLFGDFHSHKQSQRAFLRLIRMYQNRPDHAPQVICMEMFRSKDQQHLNAWLSGHITDNDLMEAVNYEHTWGFPWNNYKPIVEYCKYQNIPVIGINTVKGGKETLDKRDAHTAAIIQKLAQKSPNIKILCMIGEFHLADRFLPNAINASGIDSDQRQALRIFANLDKYFFAIQPHKIHRKDEYLELNRDTFCVINSPPWMKWHSHSLWEEMRRVGTTKYLEDSIAPDDPDTDLASWEDDDESIYTDESLDLDYHLRHLQKQIADFLKIGITSEIIERFNVVQECHDENFVHIPSQEKHAFFTRASADGVAVDYSGRLVYMPEISINNMAAAAGQMLFGSISQLSETYTNTDDLFTVQCLKYTFGFIANKILNPRMPLQNTRMLESYILSSRGKRLIGLMRQRRAVAQAALDTYTWISDHWPATSRASFKLPSVPAKFLRLDKTTSHELAKSLAQLVAEPICRGLVRGKIDLIDLQSWFVRDCKNIKAAKETLAAMIALTDK